MTDRRFIKPAINLGIRDPASGKWLPEAGKAVAWDSYWQRRLDQGDVIETSEAAIAAAAKKAAASTDKGDDK